MPRLLLNLRDVPDDEIDDVLALMAGHDIECYETPRGPFGITAGALWLRRAADYPRARELMDQYQHERTERARARRQEVALRGDADTLWSYARRHPLRVVLVLAGSLFVLMVLFAPLIELAGAH